jgi:hypothetical protein
MPRLRKFKDMTENSKAIISLSRASVDGKSKDGYVNVQKWTSKEGGTFSLWESRKPIFDIIMDPKELFYLMKGDRIEIEKDKFDESFFDNVYRK